MSSSAPLFSVDLIPSKLQTDLPKGYTVRPLQRDDFERGYLETLKDLAFVGEISEEKWLERFDWMAACKGAYYTIVIADEAREEGKQIVATGTLVAEKKFIYNLGTQGHIEDIVVNKDEQGKKLGLKLLAILNHIAKEIGCYKAVLDCSPKNIAFYNKCGYDQAGVEMCCYFDEEARRLGV